MEDLRAVAKSILVDIGRLIKRNKEVQTMTVTLSRKYLLKQYETHDVQVSVTRPYDSTKEMEPQLDKLKSELETYLYKNDPILGKEVLGSTSKIKGGV